MKCGSTTDVKHSSSGYGAIAQLGERVLCKHEVVGSIPSGSTSLRSRSEQGCHAGAQRAKADWLPRASAREARCFPDWITRNHIVRENIVPQSTRSHQSIGLRDF